MTRKAKTDGNTAPNVDKKMAKQAILWLKKKALEHVKRSENWEYFSIKSYDTGAVMQGLGLAPVFEERNKVYQKLVKALKRAVDVGLLEDSTPINGARLQFRYVGPEVDVLKDKIRKTAAAKKDRATKLLRRMRIRGKVHVTNPESTVEIDLNEFLKLERFIK